MTPKFWMITNRNREGKALGSKRDTLSFYIGDKAMPTVDNDLFGAGESVGHGDGEGIANSMNPPLKPMNVCILAAGRAEGAMEPRSGAAQPLEPAHQWRYPAACSRKGAIRLRGSVAHSRNRAARCRSQAAEPLRGAAELLPLIAERLLDPIQTPTN